MRALNRASMPGSVRAYVGYFLVLISLLVATAAHAVWWTGTDDRPRPVAAGGWHFSIKMPVYPVGQVQFVSAEYAFYDEMTGVGSATDGISVDYAFDGPGVDWADPRIFLAIEPTLFDLRDGFINGWSDWALVDGKFEGTVYATAPLIRVSFTVAADGFVQTKGRSPYTGGVRGSIRVR
jgi:hypothetical protein